VIEISIDLRQIALIIILLRAGLSLDLRDLKKVGKQAVLLSFIPATFEMIGAIVLGPLMFGLTILESAILGSILAAVSPAVIVPKMLKMIQEKHGTEKSIPQMIMAGASGDDIYVILVFTSLIQLAQGNGLQWQTILNIPLSIIFGITGRIVFGVLFVWFFKKFHIRDTSKVLLILSLGLLFLTIEKGNIFPFSGLLATITMGITMLMKYPILADRLVKKYEKNWFFSETMLFILVGAAVDITTIPTLGFLGLIFIFGMLIFRSIGVLISTQTKN
jgi:solute carrier family 9B (sodium/hydrogen exchanger), member 1/2